MEGHAQSFATSVLRADDLLDLHFEFLNLRLEAGEPSPALVRIDAAADAFVIVTFPPQHVGEEAFDETLGAPDAPPVRALLAGPTRLAFRVPHALQRLPFSIDSILAWNALEPSLASGAFASGSPAEPSATTTSIEAPFRLVLSPGPDAGWAHAAQPVTSSAGWTELWHTRLTSQTVRAIWSPDLAAPPPPGLPNMSLSSQDRLNFVRLSAAGDTADRADPGGAADAQLAGRMAGRRWRLGAAQRLVRLARRRGARAEDRARLEQRAGRWRGSRRRARNGCAALR